MSDEQGRIDYTNKDYESLRAALLELAAERLPEWTDHSPNDMGVVLLELFAHMGDSLFYNQDRIAAESFLATARERRSVVNLLRLIGYELRPPTAASADLTLLFANNATGSATIPTGAQFTTTKESTGVAVKFQLIKPAVTIARVEDLPLMRVDERGELVPFVVGGARPIDNTVFRAYETLPVVQVDDPPPPPKDILGSSDGSAGQRFRLALKPLIDETLVVTVDEGASEAWTRVPSLLHSSGRDKHYVVRRDEDDYAWIEFGNNTYGKAPRRGRNNITARYLVGGGEKGNVPPRAISKIVITPDVPGLKRVMNVKAASGGGEHEAATAAAARAPQQFRSSGRAVTAADYELHAKSYGVAKVRAFAPSWNKVNLVVAPEGGGAPSETLRRDLEAYFDGKRMITTQIEIVDPKTPLVLIEGDLVVEPRFSQPLVKARVEAVMRELWSFANVDFEDHLYISKIYEAIEGVEGVGAINITRFARADAPAGSPAIPPDGTLRFSFNEIPDVKGISLNSVTGGRLDA
ncbi:baseplate J/gp47 family protein [Sorangium sp. So ce693]|uniref:baseplate J/gp47 family protein n=1 Tax=Sorangium sp. So ce693 TaxID=3133318 RepID=UPI003F6058C3